MSSMKLREIEKTKIECARKFFAEIGQQVTGDKVKYDVVTDYAKLMDVVGRKLLEGDQLSSHTYSWCGSACSAATDNIKLLSCPYDACLWSILL